MNEEIVNQLNTNLELFLNSKRMVDELLNSQFNILEFAHNNIEYNVKDIENAIKIASLNDKIFVSKINAIVNSRNSIDIYYEIDNIINKILNDKSFDIIDYYNMTKLDFKDLLSYCKLYHDEETIRRIKNFCNRYKENIFHSEIKIVIEKELEDFTSIQGRLITKEEKEIIFNYLKERRIPINVMIYKVALKKYIDGNLIESQKVKNR